MSSCEFWMLVLYLEPVVAFSTMLSEKIENGYLCPVYIWVKDMVSISVYALISLRVTCVLFF